MSHPVWASQHFKANWSLKFFKAFYLVFWATITLSFCTVFHSLSPRTSVSCVTGMQKSRYRCGWWSFHKSALFICILDVKPVDGLQEMHRVTCHLGCIVILSTSINTGFSCWRSIRQKLYFPPAFALCHRPLVCTVLCHEQLQRCIEMIESTWGRRLTPRAFLATRLELSRMGTLSSLAAGFQSLKNAVTFSCYFVLAERG